jgi:hypothetical protein
MDVYFTLFADNYFGIVLWPSTKGFIFYLKKIQNFNL